MRNTTNTTNTITSFKDLFSEIFYDWGMTKNPQIKKDKDGYWINKTSIFKENNNYYLTYKTTTFEITPEVYNQFVEFYEIYKEDSEFEKVLEAIESTYPNIVNNSSGYEIGAVQLYPKDFKYYLQIDNHTEVIKKSTFLKFAHFVKLTN